MIARTVSLFIQGASFSLSPGARPCWRIRKNLPWLDKYQLSPCFLVREDFSDPFFDEADELLSFVDMLEDDQSTRECEYLEETIEHESSSETVSSNGFIVDDAEYAKDEMPLHEIVSHEKSDENEIPADKRSIDNLIVPDLNTMLSNMQLAPASEIAYFYLQNTIGLEPEVMWKITNTDGSVLGFTVQNLEDKINLWRRMMNVSDEDIRKIITKQPSILHMSAKRNISPTVLFLVRSLDLSKNELRQMVTAYPCILCYSIHNLARKLNFFEKNLEMDKDSIRELLLDEPKLLTAAVKTGLVPRFDFLHREIKIPILDLQNIIKANPRLLLYSVSDNIQPKLVSFFIMRLYMEPKDILKILSSYPLIMDYNLEDHMLPIVRYFIAELDFSPMEMRRIILKFPRLMTHSLFKIKHVVGFLRYQLGMDANEVKRVLFQAPQVISLSTDDTLVSKVTFLRDFFDLQNEKELRKVISGMPTLLLCNIEKNLKPKAEYLLKCLGDDTEILRQAILTLPTLLGYSLDKRVRPRMARLIELEVDPIKITVGITMKHDNFEKWLENKRVRKQNGGLLVDTEKARKNQGKISNINADLEEQHRTGRIVHWKR